MAWPAITVLILVAFYLWLSHRKFGFTYSISQTRYEWAKPPLKYSEAFTLFSLVLSIGAFIQTANPWCHNTKTMLFIAGLSMIFVPIASLFKDDPLVAKIHYSMSVIAISAGMAAITLQDWTNWGPWALWWIALLVTLIAITAAKWRSNLIYKIEVYAILIIFGRLAWV